MQITAFFVESRELAFPLFVISFFFGGMGMVLQVSCLLIYLSISISISKKLLSIFPGCMCKWVHCDSFEGFGIQNEYYTRCIWYVLVFTTTTPTHDELTISP